MGETAVNQSIRRYGGTVAGSLTLDTAYSTILHMTKREKRLARIRNNPKNVRFEELDRLLRDYGFERRQPSGGSSHYFYICAHYRLTVPRKRPFIKQIYVKQVIRQLEEMENE